MNEPQGPPPHERGGTSVARWLIFALVVLALASAAGVGAAYVISLNTAAPRPSLIGGGEPTTGPTTEATAGATAGASAASPLPGGSTTPGATDSAESAGASPPSPSPSASTPPLIHVVQPGETLTAIARRYGVPLQRLARVNGITDPNRILVGQRLVIPAAPEPATPAPSPSG